MANSATKITLVSLILLLIPVLPAFNQVKQFRLDGLDYRESEQSILPSYTIREQSNDALKLEYVIKGFSVSDIVGQDKKSYKLVRIEGFGISSEAGAPALPIKTEKIVIPAGKVAVVKVTSLGFTEYKDIDIFPAQELGTDDTQFSAEFKKNDSTYRSNEYFPVDLCQLADIQVYRGISLGYLKISPVQYNPVTRTARIHTKLNIVIEFKDSKKALISQRNHKETSDFQILQNLVLNKELLPPVPFVEKSGIELQPKGYLIVTVPQFEAAAERLAQWKRQLGYYVEISIQETWTIAQVKSIVADKYNNSQYDFEYLTILGDQDHVPDYYYESSVGNILLKIYSQNYYVCMDGPFDYMPEMVHGRISVRNSDEALLVVNKIINYEKNPPAEPGFYNKGLHAGYFQDSTHDGVSDYRYAKTTIEMYDYMSDQGFQSDLVLYTEPDVTPNSFSPYFTSQTTLPSKYRRSNGYAWDGDKFDILNALNNGRLYAFHRDHGHSDKWVQPNFTVDDMNLLNNGNELPIVFSVNCGTGHFVTPEPFICFAEKLQRHPNGGAVGIVAATAETFSGYNDGFIIGMMDAIWSSPGIIPDMGGGTDTATVHSHHSIYTMGNVMIQGLIRMTETWDPSGWADKLQFNLYHYFGDPAMQVWTAPPVQITAHHETYLPAGSTSLHISGVNCTDAIITVCYGNEIWKKVRLQYGSVTVHFPAPLDASMEEITLTISKHNYIPYVTTISVIEYPEVEFTADETELCPADVVEFTDLTENDPIYWLWGISPATFEFVNSTTAGSQHPQVRFLNAGRYSVSLTATNQAGSIMLTKSDFINVHSNPDSPVTTNVEKCYPDEIPSLTAEGSNIRWYSDEGMKVLLHEGNEYTPSDVIIGENFYFANQTVEECESEPAITTLTAFPITPTPEVYDYTVCEYDTVFCVAGGTFIKWYSDMAGEELIADNDTLILSGLAAGEHIYFAGNTENNCESELESVTILVYPSTPTPLIDDYTICEYDTAFMVAEGTLIKWYVDSLGSGLLIENDTLRVCNLTPGEHVYYASNTENSCESELIPSAITVNAQPWMPVIIDMEPCLGDTVVLMAEGENILWYSGIDSVEPIYSGNDYYLGQPEIGEYEYYVTQSVLSCESERHQVLLSVNVLPFFSLGEDKIIDLGDTLDLESPILGQYLWFDGSSLNTYKFFSTQHGLGEHICWLQVTSAGACSYTDSLSILVKKGTESLDSNTGNPDFILYPNPTEGILYLEIMQSVNIPAEISVRDMQGRIIFSQKLTGLFSEIELSQLPGGIYLITIAGNHMNRTLKIILNK